MQSFETEYGPFPKLGLSDCKKGYEHVQARISQLWRHDLRGRKESEKVNSFELENRGWLYAGENGNISATAAGKRFISRVREESTSWTGEAAELLLKIKNELIQEGVVPCV